MAAEELMGAAIKVPNASFLCTPVWMARGDEYFRADCLVLDEDTMYVLPLRAARSYSLRRYAEQCSIRCSGK
jgi:hypothetical protein